ncbi:MAG TPA: DNA polymerase Y family protein [Candidatus Binataceae bacterium]|nr:DNA polymerase Y family protein [Candidatus Binataceae bacterium]
MERIACIAVADFSIAALVRANPALRDVPVAIGQNLAPHGELISVSANARAAAVRSTMTIAQARTILPGLCVVLRSAASESSALDALADAALSLSPVIEPDAAGHVWLDLKGLGRLYDSEEHLAAELVRRVARIGMDAAVGIASNKEIAYLAARCGGVRVIEPGREREFLDWMPLDAIGLDEFDPSGALEATLMRWGMRRLGDLARLNPDAVATRLGRYGVRLVRIARGEELSPLVARPGAETFAESIELDYGIENLEAFAFVVRPLIERLMERLAMRAMVAGGVKLALDLDGRRKFDRRVAIGAPTSDARAILTLIMLNLETAPPPASIEQIRIEIEARPARGFQADMFLPPTPAPDRLETTIARLAAICGPDNVGTLRHENSYRPEAIRLEPFAPAPPSPVVSRNGDAESENITRLIVRAIRPALEIEVLENRGAPEFVRGANIGARVVSTAGPWRMEVEWWRDGADDAPARAHRDYYEFALADGGVYRAYRELKSNQWFIDGVYD